MPCAWCGEFCPGRGGRNFYRWHSEWRANSDPNPDWLHFEVDQEDPRLFWFIVCRPTCAVADAVRALDQAEAALHWIVPRWLARYHEHWFGRVREALTRAALELDDAWWDLDH